MIYQIPLLILSIIMLWYGAKFLIESAEKIAVLFGISELVIGLTVVAFGTSAPEFAVSINAALSGHSSISVGNIIGSNIFNLGFILGVVAFIRPIKTSAKLVYRDGIFMILVTWLLVYFFYNDKNFILTRTEGIVLAALLIFYLLFLFIKKEALEDEEIKSDKATLKDFLILPISITIIILGGKFLVSSASEIAKIFGMSEWLISITIVAAGTSAPEMVTSLAAVLKNKPGMSAGNLIGSNIFNILGVLGVASVINPLIIKSSSFTSLILLGVMVTIIIILMRIKWVISKIEGAIIFLLGILLWLYGFIA